MPGAGSFVRRPQVMSTGAAVVIGVAVMALCWMILMPPGSGPDEPGHLVRAGAVARGEFNEQATYSLLDSYQVAEPGCYAFQPDVPVSCALNPQPSGAEIELPSRAGQYPVWGHGVFGVPTLLPGLAPLWWARLAGVAVATFLVGSALAHAARTNIALAAGLLLGVTPMAWSTFGTINPSSLAIAGSIALWVGLLVPRDQKLSQIISPAWLTAAGWAALTLPRRDGLVWACITLVIALGATRSSTLSWWKMLSRSQRVTIGASTVVIMIWGALSDSRSTQFVVVAPLVIVAAEVGRWWWNRPAQTSGTRWAGAAVAALLVPFAAYVAIDTRPGGWDTDLAIDIVMQTDDNIVEAIGVLGWLDTVVPTGAVYLWLIALGMMVALVLAAEAYRSLVWASVLAITTIVTSWVLELVQGNTSGTYWQGRYSIPLVVGIPLLLGIANFGRHAAPVAYRVVGATGLLIANIAMWAAARRFGVGVSGSLLPWRWDTPIQPVQPMLLLMAHAAASVSLGWIILRPTPTSPTEG